MQCQSITKADVPDRFTPQFLRMQWFIAAPVLVLALIAGAWLSGLVVALISIAMGVLLGLPAGILCSIVELAYAKDLSARSKEKPRLKWISLFVPIPTPSGCLHGLVVVSVFTLGLVGIALCMSAVYAAYPLLFAQIAEASGHANRYAPKESFVPGLFVFAWLMGAVPSWRIMRWHDSLPE